MRSPEPRALEIGLRLMYIDRSLSESHQITGLYSSNAQTIIQSCLRRDGVTLISSPRYLHDTSATGCDVQPQQAKLLKLLLAFGWLAGWLAVGSSTDEFIHSSTCRSLSRDASPSSWYTIQMSRSRAGKALLHLFSCECFSSSVCTVQSKIEIGLLVGWDQVCKRLPSYRLATIESLDWCSPI